MPKRKYFEDDNVNGNALPLPIQTFLWRQTSPFIRPKLGKLHEATCVSFEKVLVQNIQFGLSPSLTQAIRSIPRWRLVQAALPHVMHCCASMLYNRRDNIGRLGSGETKLLYTLHWILLDAAEECSDESDFRSQSINVFRYLFSITTIEVFVYLFAPLCFYLKESDFQSFRLENGLKIWQAMWEYRQPDIPCFTAHVKPRRTLLRGRRSAKSATQFGDVFLGTGGLDASSLGFNGPDSPPTGVPPSDLPSGSSRDEHPVESTTAEDNQISNEENQSQSAAAYIFEYPIETAGESSKLETRKPKFERASSGHSGELCKMSSSDTSTSAHIEIICEICHTVLYNKQGEMCGSCKCEKSSSQDHSLHASYLNKSISPVDKEFAQKKLDSALMIQGSQSSTATDVSLASVLDVAVLRCLFITQWLEEGVFWGLQYLLHRLQEIYDDTSTQDQPRQRSNSLPIPKIEVSLYQSPETKKKEVPPSPSKEPPPTPAAPPYVAESPYLSRAHLGEGHHRRSSEKSKHKKMKMADLKAFVDSKLRSRSEKQLENIGSTSTTEPLLFKVPGLELSLFWGFPRAGTISPSPSVKALASGPSMSALPGATASSSGVSTTKDDSAISSEDQEIALYTGGSLKEIESEIPRPRSAMGNYAEQKSDPECLFRVQPASEMVRGKSMPSLRHIEDCKPPDRYKRSSKSVREKPPPFSHSIPNPIITVTEHTPSPSPDIFTKTEQKDTQEEGFFVFTKRGSMIRSQTDSNIKYTIEEIQEVSGSVCYITKDGGINYLVVLKAVHCVTLRDNICTLRVCEVILNLLDTLLDMNLLKSSDKDDHEDSNATKMEEKTEPLKKDELTVHNMFMNSLIRVFKHLGCPHGCGDGHRGPPADFLRSQAQNTLKRLLRIDASQFRHFLKDMITRGSLTDILDFFHAFVGFCVDPSSLLSPLGQKRTGARHSDTPSQGGYATNFGAGPGEIGTKGIEGQVMACLFKVLITRMVRSLKELKNPENMGIYCDVRQLMTYTKEAHGSIFRRVALSGLLDSADRPHKKGKQMKTQTAKIYRRNTSTEHDDHRDSPYSPTMFIVDEVSGEKSSGKKSLFRKKGTMKKSSSSQSASLQSIFDERDDLCPSPLPGQSPAGSLLRQQRVGTPRLSLSEDESLSVSSTPVGFRRKISRFQIVNWLKGEKMKHESSHEEDSGDSPIHDGAEKLTRRASLLFRTQKLHHHKGGHLLKMRKRMEDHLYKIGFGRNKSKHGSFEEPIDLSRRNSLDFETASREAEMVIIKERKIVSIDAVRNGMMRFAFLMETCQPGLVPDPPLIAAALDLQAPVVARAALLLETAYFIHRCNKGQWPTWMKLNLPMFRLSGPLANRGTPSGMRGTHILQRAAGRMFYQWGEAIGSHLEELIAAENLQFADILSNITDDVKKRQLHIADEEEDFLDEASVNPTGNTCPFALKMVAVQVLLEITAFLRETHQYLPKTSRLSHRERPNVERGPVNMPTNRRWSMGLSTMWFSQTSAQSLVSITDQAHSGGFQNERRISFVLHEADAESVNSSNTTLTMQEDTFAEEKKGRRLAQGRAHLLRRGGPTPASAAAHNASFKRRSFKLRKSGKIKDRVDEDDPFFRRSDSIKSKRKVSAVSDRSDTSEHADASGEESPGILSDEQAPDSPNEIPESDDNTLVRHMPWLKVVVQLSNTFNYTCTHQQYCHPDCYRRQMRACSRLIKAVRKVYGDDFGFERHQENIKDKLREKEIKKEKKMTRKTSNQLASGSPVKRKESFGKNMDKIDKNIDISVLGAMRSRPGSMTHLARETIVEQHLPDKDLDDREEEKTKRIIPKEKLPILKYLKTQVQNLFHSSLSLLVKGAVILSEDLLVDILPVAWELLLESDQELSGSAAVIFILSSVKAPDQAVRLMRRELQHEDVGQRVNAVLRFQTLWRFRYQAWPRMEDNAHNNFKVPPPGIDFTLPSPKIGIDACPSVDPPWMPHFKTKVEEVTLNQDRSRTFVTATKTRKKQQMELIQTALLAEEERRRLERENFLISTVAVNMQAAYEPALYHAVEEHDELDDDQTDQQLRSTTHHIQIAQSLFPSCLCSAAVPIINLLDDAAVSPDGTSVYQVAYQTIWNCLVEDSALFLRHFLEKLTRERQDEMFQILRRLIRFFPKLPPQAGFALFNYLVGYIMFYVRTPAEGGQELIGSALSLLWMIVPSVQGILLKDLKQILRKEQCDTTLLITANVPSAKKVIIHGPDVSGIPSQFPIHEDTQFYTILQDSLEFFGIDESEHDEWHLVDHKSNQIHNPNAYVRDFYFFKRSQYPQLTMIRLSPEESYAALQKQAFAIKFVETGKVLLMLSILRSSNQLAQRVFFLHEELQKLPSFPRKALETEFGLYSDTFGKCLLNIDVFHKLMWVKLVSRMFEGMAGSFAHSSDIHLFINVLNGALILHCEDSIILRMCCATFINAARHFKNIFALNGYLLIVPTMLRIYSSHQTNHLLCHSIEYVFHQFYILHRKPFILQMFGSVAPILDADVTNNIGDVNKVEAKALFKLLLTLEKESCDPIEIMELVEGEKPLKALDFCYLMEPDTFPLLDAISLCITVVAYAADSLRGHQMLTILEAILPFYLKHLQIQTNKTDTPGSFRAELLTIHQISVCMKALINNSESLSKNYTGPQNTTTNLRGSSMKNPPRNTFSPVFEFDEDNHSRYVTDHNVRKQYDRDIEDSEVMRSVFRKPRDALLNVVTEFLTKCTSRLIELNKRTGQENKIQDLLDTKCHLRLAEVAHSLLKVSPYDPITMACRGLQHYMNDILPMTDWSQEAVRPALIMIMRRLDKTFNKVYKKPAIRRNIDWEAAANLLKGIYQTLARHPYVAHLPHLKTLISVCQSIILGDTGVQLVEESISNMTSSAAILNQAPPQHFSSVVIRLIAMQMLALEESYSLEQVCGGSSVFPSNEKTENMLMDLILPLCLRTGCGRRDMPRIRQSDVSYALTVILNALNPPMTKIPSVSQQSNKLDVRSSISMIDKSPIKLKSSVFQIAFLGLKILIICFEPQLSGDWHRIAHCIKELGSRNQGGISFWSFLDFVVTHRTPLYVLLIPFIQHRILQSICDNDQEYYYQQLIREKLQGFSLPTPKCKGTFLVDLAHEMKKLKEELSNKKPGEMDHRKSIDPYDNNIGRKQRSSFAEFLSEVANGSNGSSSRQGPTPGPAPKLVSGMSVSSGSVTSQRSGLMRQWSVRSESQMQKSFSIRLKTSEGGTRNAMERLLRRTSLHEVEGYNSQDILQSNSPSTSSEPRLVRRSTTLHIRKPSGKRSLQDSATTISSESPRSPQTPSSIQEDGTPPDSSRKHRLQRQMAQSRKTFRFRSSSKGNAEISHSEIDNTETKPITEPVLLEEDVNGSSIPLTSTASSVSTAPSTDVSECSSLPAMPSTTSPPSSTVATKSLISTASSAGTKTTITNQLPQPTSTSAEVQIHPPRRRGAVIRSRSPSQSPDHLLNSSSISTDMYVCTIPQCDSVESLSNSENSALLKESEKTHSETSLYMVFDSRDEDTLL